MKQTSKVSGCFTQFFRVVIFPLAVLVGVFVFVGDLMKDNAVSVFSACVFPAVGFIFWVVFFKLDVSQTEPDEDFLQGANYRMEADK